MANKDFYKASEVPQFQEEVCKKTCVMKGKCIDEGQDNHWFLMCPHYFNWKLGIKTFVSEQIDWAREHPEEAEAKHKELVARAKAWGDEQRRIKKEVKEKEKLLKKTLKK